MPTFPQDELPESNSCDEFEGLAQGPALRPGLPMQAPPLSACFVPRPEISDAVKSRLLANDEPESDALPTSVIQGPAGAGKSVLAAALAYDPEIQARFPDGVLWATLGREPEPLSLLASWLYEGLGDYEYQPPRLEDATIHLRTLLRDKACLVVVDDVWDASYATPFAAGGARCHVIVTTQRPEVTETLAARLFSLDPMTEDQSSALLAAQLGRPLEGEERDKALQVARAVGYSPLALELAMVPIRRGVMWGELHAALEAQAAQGEALERARGPLEQPRLKAAFSLSLNVLQTEDPGLWHALLWLGVLPGNATLAAPAAATVWGVTNAEANDLLELLRREALLLPSTPVFVHAPGTTGGWLWRGYRLHALLHTLIRGLLQAAPPGGLGLTLPKAHAVLLDRYRRLTHGDLWHTLPDDGYIHRHLAWHLARAGREDELHALLREETPAGRNGWFEAREALGQTGDYLADVHRAWALARSQAAGSEPARGTGLACRYALIAVSLNDVATNVPPDLLAALVRERILTAAQGLAYARQIRDPERRAQALARLAAHLPAEHATEVLTEALYAARAIGREGARAQALRALAPHLPRELQGEALDAARTIKDKGRRRKTLAMLAPQRPGALKEKALAAARAIGDNWKRVGALARLGLNLPKQQRTKAPGEALPSAQALLYFWFRAQGLGEALALVLAIGPDQTSTRGRADSLPAPLEPPQEEYLQEALAIGDKQLRAVALARLAPHLSGEQRAEVLREALVAARAIHSQSDLVRVLVQMGSYLPAELIGEALAVAQTISIESGRAYVLVQLGPYIPAGMIGEALATARAIGDRQHRAEALTGLAPHLPVEQRTQVLLEALAVARTVGIEPDRWRVLAGLAPYLPVEALGEALAAVQAIEYQPRRVEALTELGPHLLEGLRVEVLAKALRFAQHIEGGLDRARALARLSPHLPAGKQAEVLAEALAAALTIRNDRSRAWVLMDLAPHLSGELLGEALAATETIQAGWARIGVLARLAPRLPDEQRARVLEEGLNSTRAMRDEFNRARALAELGPHLSAELLKEALDTAGDLASDSARGQALVGLVSSLPAALLEEALAAARGIGDERWRAEVLARLVLHPLAVQRAEVLQEALAAARAIEDEQQRSQVLERLVPHLPDRQRTEVLGEALSAARAVEDGQQRAETLAGLVPHLPDAQRAEVLEEALAAAWTIEDHRWRGRALAMMADVLIAVPRASLNRLWHERLIELAVQTREDLLSDLRAFAPVLYRLGGDLAVAEAFRAIQDVDRWWP
jgi:hypothetical protein